MPGAQVEMIGICENDFRAEFFERFLRQGFDGSLRSHGHEERSLDGAVGRGQAAAAAARRVGLRYFIGKIHLRLITREQYRRGAHSTSVYQEKMNAQPTRSTT